MPSFYLKDYQKQTLPIVFAPPGSRFCAERDLPRESVAALCVLDVSSRTKIPDRDVQCLATVVAHTEGVKLVFGPARWSRGSTKINETRPETIADDEMDVDEAEEQDNEKAEALPDLPDLGSFGRASRPEMTLICSCHMFLQIKKGMYRFQQIKEAHEFSS